MPSLTSISLLTFDVYGTLIDWETGLLLALHTTLPLTKSLPRKVLLSLYHHHESAQQALTPTLPYSTLLTTIHPLLASSLNLPAPTQSQSEAFGNSVGTWPAFPDTVSALHRLQKHYKLVVLSNVDRASFSLTNSGPLEGFKFDKIITAQDVGSYKPSLQNFTYMLKVANNEFGVKKEQVLQTAQSQFHDHRLAKEMGIKSSWIVRGNPDIAGEGEEIWDWKFDSLAEMADAVEREFEAGGTTST